MAHYLRFKVLVDYDVGAVFPEAPEAVYGDFDWFLTMVRFGRLLSRTYEALFSVSATLSPPGTCLERLAYFDAELEKWRLSIPDEVRPGEERDFGQLMARFCSSAALRLHYHYYSLVIALSRLKLHVTKDGQTNLLSESRGTLVQAARVVIQLTKYIVTEASTPIW
jgi:hypothetical protein